MVESPQTPVPYHQPALVLLFILTIYHYCLTLF